MTRLGTVILIAAFSFIGFSSVAPAAVAAPARLATCDQAPGATIASSERWRVFWQTRRTRVEIEHLQARALRVCRRGDSAVRRVRVVGRDDDVYGSFQVLGIERDLMLLQRWGRGGWSTRLIDLATGRWVFVPDSPGDCGDSSSKGAQTFLLNGGALVSTPYAQKESCDGPVVIGETTLSAGGVVSLGTTTGLATPVQSRTDAARAVYITTTDGVSRKVSAPGRAAVIDWSKNGGRFPWTAKTFAAPRTSARLKTIAANGVASVSTRQTFDRRGREVTLDVGVDHLVDPIENRPRTRLSALTPGSRRAVKVLASNGYYVLVAGRFADSPAELRVRLYGGWNHSPDAPKALADLPGSVADAIEAIVTVDQKFVLAFPDRVEIWKPDSEGLYRSSSLPAVGPHDLATWQYSRTVYFTDRDGVRSTPL